MLPAAAQDALEAEWLAYAVPVLNYGEQRGLDVQIALLSDAPDNHPPLGMGARGDQCRLTLALRGNRGLHRLLADVPPSLLRTLAEAMVAHELGHCWRHVRGRLHTLPEGDDAAIARIDGDPAIARMRREMSAERREEAYADLVALAWVRERQPADYARTYDWLVRVRRFPHDTARAHDTRSWLRLAADPDAFAGDYPDVFERAQALWEQALLGRR